jgi:hypothetical protein
MTIVTIVMIMAAIVAPSAARTFAIYRAQEFASDVLMTARAARRESMESGRAVAVRFLGTHVAVYRGNSSLCRATDWTTTFGTPCDSSDDIAHDTSCVGVVSAAEYSTSFHAVELAPVGGADFDVCYQPNGEAMGAAVDGTNFTRIGPAVALAAQFEVRRLEGGTSVDPERRLIIPFDSAPRSGR